MYLSTFLEQHHKSFLLAILVLASGSTWAKTVYIHDVVRVDLRAGPTNGYKIINFLRSGTPLRVLDTSEDGKWTQVKHKKQVGWLQSQYLTNKPVAADLLTRAKQQLSNLVAENKSLKEKLANTENELNSLKAVRSQLDSSNNNLQEELEKLQRISRNAINTEHSYRKLQESTEMLKVDLETIKAENASLKDDNLKEGIKWGIFAVIAGALLAVIIPKMSTRKRRSDW